MAKYLSYGGLEKVWGLAKNYFPTVKTATANGTEVTWQTNDGISAGNVATFAVDANGLVSLQGITASSLASSHTHALSIAADSGNSQLDMSANTTYKLTAGGSTFIFKTPAHQAHQTLGLIVAASATSNSESGTRGNTTTFVNLLGGGTLKDSVQFTGSGSVSVTGANGKVTITGSHQDWGLVAAGSSGAANVTTTTSDPYINLVKGETPTFDSGVQLKGSNNVTVSANGGTITISGKANTVTGPSLTANQIILGNGSSAVKASGKTIATTLGSDDSTVPTSKAVATAISNATSGLSGAMHFIGTSSDTMTDGQTTNPTVTGVSAFSAGDVVVDATETEFVLGNEETPKWHKLGDAKSYALSSVSITGTGALGGGGTLASSRTITHNTSGVTAGSAGPTAAVSGANAISVPRITVDEYGHVTALSSQTYTGVAAAGTGRMTISANAGTAVSTLFTANVSSATNAIDFTQGTGITTAVTAYSGTTPAKVTITHAAPGTGSAMTTTDGDASAASAGSTYAVITGVTVSKDSLGHITEVSTTRQNIVSDSHHQAKNVVATTNAKTANEATANTTTFLNLVENGSVRSSHQIKGAGGVSVASTAAGVITITGTTYTVNNATLSLQGTSGNATSTGFSANGNTNTTLKFAVTGSAVTGVTTTAASDGVATITIASASSLKNPNSFTVGTKASSTGTATNFVTYDGSASGKAIYFSTAAKSTTNVQFAVDANGFVTGTVNDSGNTASLKVSDATNRKISTTETSSKYIQFTGGTNKFTVTDGTSSFDVSVANGMEEITEAEINTVCVI